MNAYDHVPLHRTRLDAAGIEPGRRPLARRSARGCRSRVKSDLRDHYPFGMFARPLARARARCTRRPGTTGKPTVVGYTRRDLATGPT